jgi:ATP-dependent DNA helicase 2 subunit 1
METPDVAHIALLERLLGTRSPLIIDRDYLAELCGIEEYFSPFEALFDLSALHSRSGKHTKKIGYLFTAQDSPFKKNDDWTELQKLIIRSEDISAASIALEVCGISTSFDIPFNYSKVYGKLNYFAYPDDDDPEGKIVALNDDYRDLKIIFEQKQYNRRVSFNVPLFIAPDLVIGVRGFNLFMEKKMATHALIDRLTSDKVASKTNYVCETTSKLLEPKELNHVYPLGDTKVIFTKEEVTEIKSDGQPRNF